MNGEKVCTNAETQVTESLFLHGSSVSADERAIEAALKVQIPDIDAAIDELEQAKVVTQEVLQLEISI